MHSYADEWTVTLDAMQGSARPLGARALPSTRPLLQVFLADWRDTPVAVKMLQAGDATVPQVLARLEKVRGLPMLS